MHKPIKVTKERTCYRAARYYARHDWNVLPLHRPVDNGCSCGRPDCNSIGKHPLTRSGAKDATRDLKQIERWFNRRRSPNLGVNTERLVVIDIDPEYGGILRDLPLTQAGQRTITVKTGGNGWHLWYEAPPNLDITNSNKNCPPGIDIRSGKGAYVVAPPSLHVSGRRYAFVREREPWNIAPLPLPASLLPILTIRNYPSVDTKEQGIPSGLTNVDADHPYVRAAVNYELDQLAQAPKGNRNNTLNQAAFSLGQFIEAGLLSRPEIEAILEQAAIAIGLSQSESQSTIRSGLNAGIKSPRRNWPDFD